MTKILRPISFQSCLTALLLPASILALSSAVACGTVKVPAADGGGDDSDADVGVIDAAPPAIDATPAIIECTESSECGEHEECVTVGIDSLCECVVGYEGEPCVFVGTLLSPGFDDDTAWMGLNGAAVNAGAPGIDDPGVGNFGANAVCDLGMLVQDIEMPRYEDAEPLVAEIQYSLTGGEMFGDALNHPSIGFNDQWHHFPPVFDINGGNGLHTQRICLSDAAYGGPVRVAISPRDKPRFDCPDNNDDTIQVDYLRIEPAMPGECATPGDVPNGNMSNDDNWTLPTVNNTDVAFADGIGLDGSRALRVRAITRCSGANSEGVLAIPGTNRVANPAIEFEAQVSTNTPVRVRMNGEEFASLSNGSAPIQRVCLPNSSHGLGANLQFSVSGGSGLCSDVINNQVIVDNVKIVDEPSCAAASPLLDGGFEYAPRNPGFAVSSQAQDGGRAFVETVNQPDLARSGTGALRLGIQIRCSTARFSRQLIAPIGDATGGPAVRVFANVEGNPVSTTSMSVAGTSFTFPENGAYTEHVQCIPPEYSGRPAPFSLQINGGSGLCASFGGTENAFFDDIEVITAEQCPSE